MAVTPARATDVRLAEVLAALSLATDVGNGFPLEKSLRTALIAASMADALELGREQAAEVYYVALLRSIGCSAFAHEVAAAFGGDDRGFRDPAAAEPYFELYDPAVVLHGFPPGVETVGGLRAAYGEIWAALPGGRIHLCALDVRPE